MYYQNEFHLSKELALTITSIINSIEGQNNVCEIIKCIITPHNENQFVSPLERYFQRGGHRIKTEKIKKLNERYGKYVTKMIPKQTFYFLVVRPKTDKKTYTFKSVTEMEEMLILNTFICERYDGVFNPYIFYEYFPYLKHFFDYLEEWRLKTNQLVFDYSILKKGAKKVFETEYIKKRMQ